MGDFKGVAYHCQCTDGTIEVAFLFTAKQVYIYSVWLGILIKDFLYSKQFQCSLKLGRICNL